MSIDRRAMTARPMRRSTVVPGKLAVLARRPVSALKSVVLPALGLPMRAIQGADGRDARGSCSKWIVLMASPRVRRASAFRVSGASGGR